MGYYDMAQVCKNGHPITGYYGRHPDQRKAFCDECGAATVTNCDSCNKPIRGEYHSDVGVFSTLPYTPHSFCPHCGKPYPWTAMKLQAAQELINELDDLDDNERNQLKQSLDDLITDNPKTEVAGLRFKRIMKKVGKDSYEVAKGVFTDILSETAKKILFNQTNT
jgi:hypothetical protein